MNVKKVLHVVKGRSWHQKLDHAIKKYIMISNVFHEVKVCQKYIMKSKSTSWRQRVCHDVKIMTLHQKVRQKLGQKVYQDVKLHYDINGLIDVKNMSKLRHDVKVMTSKIRHDVKKYVMTSKVRHDIKKYVKVTLCHYVKIMTLHQKVCQKLWHQRSVCHDVKNMSRYQKVCQSYIVTSSQPRWLSGLMRSRVHSLWLLVDHCVLRNWDRILVRAVKGLISRAGMVSICPLLWQRDVKLQQTNIVTSKVHQKLPHDVKKFVMTSKSSSWHQKLHHDVKVTSWQKQEAFRPESSAV